MTNELAIRILTGVTLATTSQTNEAVRMAVEALTSAQPEIIRCRDCANYQTDWIPQTMPDGHYCFAVDTFMREDESCSRAERREDEQDA